MSSSRFENIWKIISSNNFKEEIPSQFHCSICKNVTIDPYGSFCGCRFCHSCIMNYLKDGKKSCPGGRLECKTELLEVNVNITRDLVAMGSIGRLQVKCPNERCEVRCHLEKMDDHLKLCGVNTGECPYDSIGCNKGNKCKNDLKVHYEDEWLTHSKLIIEASDNLRNEFIQLKEIVEKKDEEIMKLTKDFERKETVIKNMKTRINVKGKEINDLKSREQIRDNEIILLKEELNTMKDDIRMIKEEFIAKKTMMEEVESLKTDITTEDLNKNIIIQNLKRRLDDQNKELAELKIKDEKRDKEIKMMNETQKKTIIEVFKNGKIGDMNISERTDYSENLNNLKVNQDNIRKDLISMITKVKKLEIFDEREFIWRVNNFSKMKDDGLERRVILWRYSRKLYLSLCCFGNNLGFYCKIMKGEFDDNLKWPMKHKIFLSIINQNTMKKHKSREYDSDSFDGDKSIFDKPKEEYNSYFIGSDFTTVKDITDSPGLLLNDSLIVSFIIDYN